MAVPHRDRSRRNAAASLVRALFAASKSLMDTVGTAAGVGAALDAGAAAAGTPARAATWGALRWDACNAATCGCHSCQPTKPAPAMPMAPKDPAIQLKPRGR